MVKSTNQEESAKVSNHNSPPVNGIKQQLISDLTINHSQLLFAANSILRKSSTGAHTPPSQDIQSLDAASNGKEVLIGGGTEDNRSARGSIRERHQVKTFSESSRDKCSILNDDSSTNSNNSNKSPLKPTFSLKAVVGEGTKLFKLIQFMQNQQR